MNNKKISGPEHNVKPVDFIPFIGSLIYQSRNYSQSSEYGRCPEPYVKYLATAFGLAILDVTTGAAIVSGIELLIK